MLRRAATNKRPRTEGAGKGSGKDKRKQKTPKGQGRSGQLSRQEAPDIERLKGTAKLALRLGDANKRRQRTASHVRSQCRMETNQGDNSGQDQSAPFLNHDGVHPQGAGGQGAAGQPGRECAEGGEGGLVGQRGGSVAAQVMGPSGQVPGDNGASSTYHHCLASHTGGTAAGCQDDGWASDQEVCFSNPLF